MRLILAAVVAMSALASAQTPPVPAPVIDNAMVTVRDMPAVVASASMELRRFDAVLVYMLPESLQGKVDFIPRGTSLKGAIRASGATRLVAISLKQPPPAALANTSGFPDAFPRPGQLRKPIDNYKITAWDYTFEPGVASPMHFHGRDVVTVYFKPGAIVATTPDGSKTNNEFSFGTIRFNPRNRTHTETVVRGESRIAAIELK
ncbi:MAG: hypothetical protein ABL986_23200 [Vicinamibacterales bacterium]